MERSSRSRRGRWWALLVLALVPGVARRVSAQAVPSVLTVRLRSTVRNAPVPHITVQVVDAASDKFLVHGTTDDGGQARFGQLPSTAVRVQLSGKLPDGTHLRPTPQDTDGIRVNLPGHDWLMDLRVDTDGLVFPDLSASAAGALDARDAPAALPGASRTTGPAGMPDMPPNVSAVPAIAHPPAQHDARVIPLSQVREGGTFHPATAPGFDVPGVLLLALLVTMIAGVMRLRARNRL
jgi:hypothetical protein